MASIIVGAASAQTRLDIAELFSCRNDVSLIRIAIPSKYEMNSYLNTTEYWIFAAQVPDGRILAIHRILKHIEFMTHDELLDRGLVIEEMLT